MKLYLLTQEENDGYDTHDACVVCAEDENAARNIMPNFGKGEQFKNKEYGTWAHTIEAVNVKYIGEAADDIDRGVIIESFNAG